MSPSLKWARVAVPAKGFGNEGEVLSALLTGVQQ